MFDGVSYKNSIDLGGTTLEVSNVSFRFNCFNSKTGQIFGTVVTRALEFDMINAPAALEDAPFLYRSAALDAQGNSINPNMDGDETGTTVGTFHVQEAPKNDTTGITRALAYDNMKLSAIDYVSELDYESGTVTVLDVLNEALELTGLELVEGQELINGGFIVHSALEVETCREVFSAVAGANAAIALIINDKLAFKRPDKDAEAVGEVQNGEHSGLIVQPQTEEISKVVLRDTLVSESTSMGDGDAILYIDDNPFAVGQAAREALIGEVFNAVLGFTYYPFTAKGLADPALNCGDPVRLFKADGTECMSFVFTMIYKSNTEAGGDSIISAHAFSEASANTKYIKSKALRLARLAYKQSKAYANAIAAITGVLNSPGGSYEKKFKRVDGVLVECSPTDRVEETWWTSKETIDNTTSVVRINSAGLGVSTDGGAHFTQAITGLGILASSIIFDEAIGAKMVIGDKEGERFEIYTAIDEDENSWPYIDGYDENGILRSRWSPSTGFQFTDSTGQFITTIATTVEDKTITVGAGKFQEEADALPYFINHNTSLDISGYASSEDIVIQNHEGSGTIFLVTDATTQINSLTIRNVKCGVWFNGIKLTGSGKIPLSLFFADNVHGFITTTGAGSYGIWTESSKGYIGGTVSNKELTIMAGANSDIYVEYSGTGNTSGYDANASTIRIGSLTVSATSMFSTGHGGIIIPYGGFNPANYLPLTGGRMTGDLIIPAAQRPTVAMTSNSAPSPYKAAADSENGAGYQAYMAFNKTYADDNSWVSASGSSRNHWLAHGMDKPIYAKKITLRNRTRASLVNGPIDIDVWACPSMPTAGVSLATAISGATLLASWNPASPKYNANCAGINGALSAGLKEITLDGNVPVQYLLINPYNYDGYGGSTTYVAIGEVYTDGDGKIYA